MFISKTKKVILICCLAVAGVCETKAMQKLDPAIEEWLRSNPNARRCPRPGCTHVFEKDAHDPELVLCPQCYENGIMTEYCSNCLLNHPVSVTCEQAARDLHCECTEACGAECSEQLEPERDSAFGADHGCIEADLVTFSSNGRYLASRMHSDLRVIDLETHNCVHRSWGGGILFSPDSRYFLTWRNNSFVRVIETVSGKKVFEAQDIQNCVCIPAFSSDSACITILKYSHNLYIARVVEIATGRDVFVQHYPVDSIAFSPNCKHIAIGDHNAVKITEIATGAVVRVIEHDKPVNRMEFSPTGEYLAIRDVASHNSVARVIDVATGRDLRGRRDGFSADWKYSWFIDGARLIVTEMATGVDKVLCPVSGHEVSVEFSPDNKYVAYSEYLLEHEGFRVILLDLETGRKSGEEINPPNADKRFSPDGRYAVVRVAKKNAVGVLELATGKIVCSVDHGKSMIDSVAFSPDSRSLASRSLDGMIKVTRLFV